MTEIVDNAVRAVALLATGDDASCKATSVSEWPDAAKLTIIAILNDPDMYVDIFEQVMEEN